MTEYKIKGILHDPQNEPISEITITAYDKDPLSGERFGSVSHLARDCSRYHSLKSNLIFFIWKST